MSEIIREVRFHRDVSSEGDKKWKNQQLEYGCELRESDLHHIVCKMQIATEKIGTLGPNWQDVDVIIPNDDGIDENGYVKEVWIADAIIHFDTIELNGRSYEIIEPYVHNTEYWIQGFKTKVDGRHINLLPSLEIAVRYMKSAT